MEPIVIGSGIVGAVSLAGGLVTVYVKLKGILEKEVNEQIEAKNMQVEARFTEQIKALQMDVQALQIKQLNIETSMVRREDMAEVKGDLKNLVERMEDLKALIKEAMNAQR